VDIKGSVCLVTGSNRGLGEVFVRLLREAGAAKVYAAARNPGSIAAADGIHPIKLDITDHEAVGQAAAACPDVSILINNAGIMLAQNHLNPPGETAAQSEMAVNYFGTMAMCRAFAPVLGRNGGGALVNILSVAAWYASPFNGTYASSKAAAWLLTNEARMQLRDQGTQVIGVYASFIDTDMSAILTNVSKVSPESVVRQTIQAIGQGQDEVLADERTHQVKAALPHDLETLYKPL
jgi:NAD(P)-dependent dehydrogenase (short-subunit alcohol dehydrogenase family)